MDGGIAADTPLLAIPINLSALLDMGVEPGAGLFVGFTAGTGICL